MTRRLPGEDDHREHRQDPDAAQPLQVDGQRTRQFHREQQRARNFGGRGTGGRSVTLDRASLEAGEELAAAA